MDFTEIFRAAPFVASIGIEAESVGDGRCESRLELAERHLQHDGFVHAGVLATMASKQSGIRFTANTARIDPIAYIGLFSFACLACGLFGMILTRWWSHRLADTAFQSHMSNFRRRLREQERLRAEQAREELARAMDPSESESEADDSPSDEDPESHEDPEEPEKSV